VKKFHVLKCWMFFLEGWRLLLQFVRPSWRPSGNKLHYLILKNISFFNCQILRFLSLSKPWIWKSALTSHLNQCRSTTLLHKYRMKHGGSGTSTLTISHRYLPLIISYRYLPRIISYRYLPLIISYQYLPLIISYRYLPLIISYRYLPLIISYQYLPLLISYRYLNLTGALVRAGGEGRLGRAALYEGGAALAQPPNHSVPVSRQGQRVRLLHKQIDQSRRVRLLHIQNDQTRRVRLLNKQIDQSIKVRLLHIQIDRSIKVRLLHIQIDQSIRERPQHIQIDKSIRVRLLHNKSINQTIRIRLLQIDQQ
jgi:hypothetical protein